jgi:hypothetical protein
LVQAGISDTSNVDTNRRDDTGIEKLTAVVVKKVKAADKAFKLTDRGGMFMLVDPKGGKYWRLAYRFARKQKRHWPWGSTPR